MSVFLGIVNDVLQHYVCASIEYIVFVSPGFQQSFSHSLDNRVPDGRQWYVLFLYSRGASYLDIICSLPRISLCSQDVQHASARGNDFHSTRVRCMLERQQSIFGIVFMDSASDLGSLELRFTYVRSTQVLVVDYHGICVLVSSSLLGRIPAFIFVLYAKRHQAAWAAIWQKATCDMCMSWMRG